MSVLKAACLMLLGVTFTTVSALGETTWPRLKHSFVTQVWDSVQVTHAGDGSGRMFIVSSDGRVMIHKDGELQGDPFLDIYGRVSRERNSGLFGIAFPDGFSEKGHFYAAYLDRDEEFIVVSRFKVRPENADEADEFSEEIVMKSAYLRDSRSVAKIGFGPDSFLYIGLGDNGSRFDRNGEPQNLGSLLGKMLRIDTESDTVPYGIPADNPFVGADGPAARSGRRVSRCRATFHSTG